jgi:hypothetical protein
MHPRRGVAGARITPELNPSNDCGSTVSRLHPVHGKQALVRHGRKSGVSLLTTTRGAANVPHLKDDPWGQRRATDTPATAGRSRGPTVPATGQFPVRGRTEGSRK